MKMSKKLVGIEKLKFVKKETGKETIAVRVHMLEENNPTPEVIGQRVIQETLWGIGDINEISISGKLEIGCKINIYYEGEGNFKKAALIICEK